MSHIEGLFRTEKGLIDLSAITNDGVASDFLRACLHKNQTQSDGLGSDLGFPPEEVILAATVMDTVSAAVIITDPEGTITYVNPAFTKLTGYSADDAIGNNPRILSSGKHDAPFYAGFWRTIKSGQTWRGEFTNRRKDGGLYYDEHVVTPVVGKDGKIIYFLGILNDITDQKKATEELRSVHQDMEYKLAHSPAVLYRLKVEGESVVPVFASGNVTRLLGFEVGETLTYEWWLKQLHPDDVETALASIPETVSCGESRTEYRIRRKDGKYVWIEDSRRLIRNEFGDPFEFIGVWVDITARKEAEALLQQSQARLRLAVEASNIGLWDWNVATGEVYYSSEWKGQLGFASDEIAPTYSEWESRLHPEDRDRAMAALQSSFSDPSIKYDIEIRLRHKDRSYRWIHSRAKVLRDDFGQSTRVLGCHMDVTERKNTEQELVESNERFRLITETINEVFWMATPDISRIEYISPSYERVWQRSCESLYENPVSFMDAIHPDDRKRVIDDLKLEQEGFAVDHEYRIVQQNNAIRWIWDRGIPYRDEHGHIKRFVGVATDVTDRKNAQMALQEAHDELESKVHARTEELALATEEANRANKAKSEFLSRMSHELRTPLNAILGFGQLLEMDDLEPKSKQSVQQIMKGGSHLLQLINEVLDICRVEAGKFSLSLEPIRVGEVLRSVVELMNPVAVDKSIILTVTENNLCDRFVKADRQKLIQVLLNVVSNAIKYNRENGRVELEGAEGEGETLVLRVVDSGVGIAEDQQRKIFTPFERLGAVNSGIEGTGLGLAVSFSLMQAMGGYIDVSSELGVGTTISLTLPESQYLADAEDPEYSAEIQVEGEGASNITKTVLYIEDNPSNIQLVEAIFDRRGKEELVVATSGDEGITLAREKCPHLILLDLNLPDITGEDVLASLKRDPQTAAIPVAMVTANAISGQAERLEAAGAIAYITKPFSVKSFIQTVDELLNAA